jgi:hypothetical protein
MKQIRDNIWQVTMEDIGETPDRGYYEISGLGELLIDQADLRYIKQMQQDGFEPLFHISQSPALNNAFVVVSRQQLG